MQGQSRLTDFFTSPARRKSSPGTPLFDLSAEEPSPKRIKTQRIARNDDIRQTILDAGQKNIGGHYCKQCDMIYCVDSISEVAMHDKHHSRFCDITRVKISASQLNIWLRKECHYSTGHGYVFRIVPDSSTSLKRKAENIIEELVNPSVGFSTDLSIWGWDQRRTVWVSVTTENCNRCIAGIIVTEPLNSAQDLASGMEVRDENSIIGVNRIWTHPSARRKGIATEILDVIRRWYFTGTHVPRNRVAFSDPSEDGRKFAEKYIGGPEKPSSFLVYAVTK
ncbi:unnamed protein product [Cylicocyclus nassatus]|uniref:N-acetyltransferase ECO1 n=1 Tax=Cylicocyclus nassatus TaxID=53992 RepID=A0AA36M5Q8_CYLNA|nr:unnamed protein product [Cylicocyclus nassatus]